MDQTSDIESWTKSDVSDWLNKSNLTKLAPEFEKQDIDGEALLLLNFDDIKENFMQVTTLGERKKFMHQLGILQAQNNVKKVQKSPSSTNFQQHNNITPRFCRTSGDNCRGSGNGCTGDSNNNVLMRDNFRNNHELIPDSLDFDENESHENLSHRSRTPPEEANLCAYDEHAKFNEQNPQKRAHHDNDLDELEIQLSGYAEEGIKTLVAFAYCCICFLITAYVMVCSAERAPEMGKYPPLPDVVLDSLPYMPWAFEFSEYCVFLEIMLVVFILAFHRYRQIILRRGLSIAGSLFLLRSMTMFVTSLSVPNKHTECAVMQDAYPNGEITFENRVRVAIRIGMGFGLTTMGVQTCGDYMFSGHTAVLTLLNHIITEYGPKWQWLHCLAWLLNAFGAFFVLAAHEHYTLDVVVALYITSRMFIYYHQLANTGPSRWRMQRHNSDIKYSNFPLFWFFEGNIPGPVPNTFESPMQPVRRFLKKFKTEKVKTK